MRSTHVIGSVAIFLPLLIIPAAFGFVCYGYIRAWVFMPGLASVPSAIIICAIVPGIFAALWLWCVVELFRVGQAHTRRRRVHRGRCWRCHYPCPIEAVAGKAEAECSECGVQPLDPPAHRLLAAHIIAVACGLALVATVPGALLAEWHLTAEDQRFIAHVDSIGRRHTAYHERAWPFHGFSLVYLPGYGFDIND